MGWLDELESDFSAIHRIDDIYAMNGPRFFKFANNMIYYPGAIRFNFERQVAELRLGHGPVVGDSSEIVAENKAQLTSHKSFMAYPESGFPAVFG